MQKKTVGKLRAGTAVLLALLLAFVLAACNPKQQQPPVAHTGSLQITVEGLTGVDAEITVTGPGSFSQRVSATTTLEDLVVGEYTVSAEAVSGHVVPGVATQTIAVTAGKSATVVVTYVAVADPAQLGSLKLVVEGLGTVAADVTVTGAGFTQPVTGGVTLENLLPGSYTVAAAPVEGFVVSGEATQTVTVVAGATAEVKVTYLAASAPRGTLAFNVQGLAAGATASLQVVGPGGFDQTFNGSEPLADLAPGNYTVTALAIPDHVVASTPATVQVVAEATTTATVTYLHAGLAVSGASTVTLPMQTGTSLTFDITRVGAFTGPVTFEFEAVGGLEIQPANGTVAADANAFTVNVHDDGANLGDYSVVVTVNGAVSEYVLEAERALELSLVAVVTESSDNNNNPMPGSLRGLVEDARTEGATLTFDPSLFDPVSDELVIALADQLAITHDLAIEGPSDWPVATGPLVRLVGNDTFRILMIDEGAEVELANLQVEQGREQNGAGIMVVGGSSLHLRAVHVHDNEAYGDGGGIWSAGNLRIYEGSELFRNKAARYGGGLFVSGVSSEVTATVTGSSIISGNEALRGAGAYLGTGTLWIDNSSVELNTATAEGGGIYATNHNWQFDRSYLYIVNGAEISGNEAVDGGGVYSYAMGRIDDAFIEDNKASGDGAGIRNHLYMTIDNSEIALNEAGGDYGGIFNDGQMIIRESRISENTVAGSGGGIFNGYQGSDTLPAGPKWLRIENSRIFDNVAGQDGGGIHSIRQLTVIGTYIYDNQAENGAGISAVSIAHTGAPANDGGTLTVRGSTIAGNIATGRGGGIYSDTYFCDAISDPGCLNPFDNVPDADVLVENSTITANMAGWGGGVYTGGVNDGGIRLNFNTILQNHAMGDFGLDGHGGGIHNGRPNMVIRGNLIAYNSGTGSPATPYDIYSLGGPNKIASAGYNVVYRLPDADVDLGATDIAPVFGTAFNLDVEQVLPAAVDGPPPVLALGVASQIRSVVPLEHCLDSEGGTLAADQRGEPRPGTGTTACSIGAYEYQGG